jgi:lipoprotein-anchoring transpeptidase ErfK/SrfK
MIRQQMVRLLACFALITTVSCSTFNPSEDPNLQADLDRGTAYDPEQDYSYWTPKASQGELPLTITIDLSEQTARFYRGNDLVGRSRVATGKSSHPTPTGSFKIIEKIIDKRSNLYGHIEDADGNVVIQDADSRRHSSPDGGRFLGAEMPYWMRLTHTGIGMHSGPIPNPGQPASHGCIRLPRSIVQSLFGSVVIGTPVKIVP